MKASASIEQGKRSSSGTLIKASSLLVDGGTLERASNIELRRLIIGDIS
jgi:hypothetical protein